jgi:hypothetical protein
MSHLTGQSFEASLKAEAALGAKGCRPVAFHFCTGVSRTSSSQTFPEMRLSNFLLGKRTSLTTINSVFGPVAKSKSKDVHPSLVPVKSSVDLSKAAAL